MRYKSDSHYQLDSSRATLLFRMEITPKQVKELAKQLIEELHSVSEHLKQLRADLRQPKPHQEPEAEPRKRATNVYVKDAVEIDLSENLRRLRTAERGEDKTDKDNQLLWTQISAGLIFVYALLTFWQACSTKEMAKTAQQQLVASQRAYISFVGLGQSVANNIGGKVAQRLIPLGWENSGTTPMIQGVAYLGHRKSPDDVPAGFDYPLDHPEGVKFQVPPRGAKAIDDVISVDDLNAIQKHTSRYFVYGTLVYRDIFPDSPVRITEFCTEITYILHSGSGEPDFTDPNMQVGFKTGDCKEHNCYDDFCLDYKSFAK